ncbi:MAG: FAD-binding protein, partial [Candidatus Zixiibacteriota bacterium]
MKKRRVNSSIYQKVVGENLFETLGQDLKQNESLAPHTTFGIGGEADFFYVARRLEDFIKAIQVAKEAKIPFFVLGGGGNVLVSDSGFKGLVIKNQCDKIFLSDKKITCQSGARLDDLVSLSGERALSGMEFAAGIPGTAGGAIYGNAGAFGKTIGDLLTEAVILKSQGSVERV